MEQSISGKTIFEPGRQVELFKDQLDSVFSYIEHVDDRVIYVSSIANLSNAEGYFDKILSGKVKIRGAIYLFKCRIMGDAIIQGGLRCTKLLVTVPPVSVELRSSFRLESLFDLEVRAVTTPESEWVPCRGIDISDTGIGFASEQKFTRGDTIQCRLLLLSEYYIVPARVVRVIEHMDSDQIWMYRIGCMFVDMERRISKRIRQHIYRLQTHK